MTIFEKNIASLRERNEKLAEKVLITSTRNYSIIASADVRLPNLMWLGDDENVFFYDPEGPLPQIKSVFTDLELEKAGYVIMLGLGLGYPLNILFSALRDDKSPLRQIIVIEKDVECLCRALEVLDLSEAIADNRVRLVVGSSEKDLYIDIWNAIAPEFGGLKAIKFVPWPASIRLASDYYKKAKEAVRDVAQSFLAERGNDPYDTLVAYENFLENLPKYLESPGLHHVKDLFKNRPGIVVAAGPSLNKNVDLLRMLEHRAVVIAADASLKVTHNHGVQPHFVTTVERTPGTEKFFEGITGLERTVLAVASFTYPETLASYKGPFLFMHRKYHFYDILGIGDDCFEMGGTTAHCAFALAEYMGCDPIIFIGQDLAFGPDGVTHAHGCAFGQRQTYAAEADRFEVPANMGGTVETCSIWFRLLREYERTIDQYGGLAINATEGGARIHGTELMTFRDAIEKHCQTEFYPREILMNHIAGKRPSATAHDILNGLNRLSLETEDVLKKCRGILSEISPVLREMEKVESEINSDLCEKIKQASRALGRMADELMKAPLINSTGEYFMSVWVPLLIEWQVVAERFKERIWAEAYRLQLGEDGFGSVGQLCLSLLDALDKGKARMTMAGLENNSECHSNSV